MAKEKEEEKKETSSKKRKSSLLTWIFLGFNLLTLILGTYFVYSSTLVTNSISSLSEQELEQKLKEHHEEESVEPLIYTMGTFNANLNGIPRRLVQLQINLEMLDAEGFEEIVSSEAKARDRIINILNSKSFSDIESVQGKLHLKNQIINQLNNFLKKGIVKALYFSDFAVQ